MIFWRPQLDPLLGGLIILALAAWMVWTFRRLAGRVGRRQALLLAAPKWAVLAVILAALFEPMIRRERPVQSRVRLLVALDVSSSMDVADAGRPTRRERAQRVADDLRRNDALDVETFEFDTALRRAGPLDSGTNTSIRETDLGAVLAALADEVDTASAAGVVLLTDGGDESLLPLRLPKQPIYAVGIGSVPDSWNDLALSAVEFPDSAEKNMDFEVALTARARQGGAPGFSQKLRAVTAAVEEAGPSGTWTRVASQALDLSNRLATVRFRLSAAEPGLKRFRAVLDPVDGELSALNNARPFAVDVRSAAIRVLYVTRELGMDYKMIRDELGRDPGLAFTAAFRTMGERFTVQSDDAALADKLKRGIPEDPAVLQGVHVLILGSFPASDWTDGQMRAVVRYVEAGGGLVWLGGADSFGVGGYAATSLAPLFPWTLQPDESLLASGRYPVSVPPAAATHPAMAGIAELLASGQAAIESLNQSGTLKPGAVVLLEAGLQDRPVPLAAVQAFGRGRTLALASNTFWKWARRSDALKDGYGRFWRQFVRYLADRQEGGRVLNVLWDKPAYRPGEQAVATIRVMMPGSGTPPRLAASLAGPEQARAVPVTPVQGQPDAWQARLVFPERGDYNFRLEASSGDTALETYEKRFLVGPLLPEGANLEVNEPLLSRLAERTGGDFVREHEVADWLQETIPLLARPRMPVDVPLLRMNPWAAALVLALLATEWILRRRRSLF
jgi:hypothetical protein